MAAKGKINNILDDLPIRDYVTRQYLHGRSTLFLSRELGCARSTVVTSLARWGVPRRHRHHPKPRKCLDCNLLTIGRRERCDWHRQLHHCELQREYDRDRKARKRKRTTYHQEKYNRRLYKLGLTPKNKPRRKPNKSYTCRNSLDLTAPTM